MCEHSFLTSEVTFESSISKLLYKILQVYYKDPTNYQHHYARKNAYFFNIKAVGKCK